MSPGTRRARERSRLGPFAALALALLGAALLAPPSRAQTQGTGVVTRASGRCGLCHPVERVEAESSPHAGEDVRCVSCHGGNDQALDEAGAHQGNGWRGRIARAQIPALCASCHADEERMRPYDLPVDQFALYQTSGHGLRLRQGDTRVAVCSDCHGAHAILSPSDPASRVYTTNVPRTCGQCHGDTTLVRQRGLKNVYQQYLGSVHAKQLFDEGNLRAPTCVSCHGVHGAAPAAVGDVNKICGRCHTAERRYFLAGPHARGMAKEKLAECSSCHGAHDIAPTRTERLATVCEDCHETGSREASLGGRLLEEIRGATREIDEADAMVAKADAVPIQTDDYRARVEEGRTYLREALTAAHAVQPEVMASFTVRARSVGSEVRSEVRGKLQNILFEKLGLIVFWFYVIVTIGILRRYRDRRAKAS